MYTDPECFSKQVNSQAALTKAAGLPFALTEFKEGLMGGLHARAHCATAYAAAFARSGPRAPRSSPRQESILVCAHPQTLLPLRE